MRAIATLNTENKQNLKITSTKNTCSTSDALFSKQIIKPAPFQRPSISHHISLNAFDDFPPTQVQVTPAPRISVDNDSSPGWQMEFTKPNILSEDANSQKKMFALRYK